MPRETCYRCFWPKPLCWCASIVPMATRTRFVFLMHPKEFKQEKAATGRLTHLCLPNSELHMGVTFDDHEPLQSILRDPRNHCALLYPGPDALNLSTVPITRLLPATAGSPFNPRSRLGSTGAASDQPSGQQLVIILLDATWALGRKMLKLSPSLQRLSRIMFTPSAPSRFVIKQQPHSACLSTLEATHELLLALARAGLDEYPLPGQLLGLFARMQEFQLRCAADPTRAGYRRQAYSRPADRQPAQGRSGVRRRKMFDLPASVPSTPEIPSKNIVTY